MPSAMDAADMQRMRNLQHAACGMQLAACNLQLLIKYKFRLQAEAGTAESVSGLSGCDCLLMLPVSTPRASSCCTRSTRRMRNVCVCRLRVH